jgi:hypothetical protein
MRNRLSDQHLVIPRGIFLVTVNGEPVYSDGKGNFSKEKNETFKIAAVFVKMSPGDEAEAYRKKASQVLGVELQYLEVIWTNR